MAYYHQVPGRKEKTNYAELGSWEEEGSGYNGRSKNKTGSDKMSSRSASGGKRPASSAEKPRSFANRSSRYKKSDSQIPVSPNARPDRKEPRSEIRPDRRPFRAEESGSRIRKQAYTEGSLRERKSRDSDVRPDRNAESRRSDFEQKEANYRDLEYVVHPSQSLSDQKEYILCGRNPIREALNSGRDIEKLLVQKGELSGSAREIVQKAKAKRIPVHESEKSHMDEIAPHHQGLIAFASAYRYADVEEMLQTARDRKEDPFLILLDGVTDPHNLGAVIRTAECVGAHGVIVPLHRSVGLTPAAVKASAGAVEHIKVARVVNLNQTIEDLRKNGIWIYAVTMNGESYEKVDFKGGTALVIGAEGEGISRLTQEKCDMSVSLPMKGSLDSLNASVAAGIVMYRVLSCRSRG